MKSSSPLLSLSCSHHHNHHHFQHHHHHHHHHHNHESDKSFNEFLFLFFYTIEDCRTIKFVEYEGGKALEGHVIATLKMPNKDTCELQCYLNNDCVSYNFGPSETGDDNICELNNSTDTRQLRTRLHFIYQGSEVR